MKVASDEKRETNLDFERNRLDQPSCIRIRLGRGCLRGSYCNPWEQRTGHRRPFGWWAAARVEGHGPVEEATDPHGARRCGRPC